MNEDYQAVADLMDKCDELLVFKSEIVNYLKDLEKELYVYKRKKNITVEQIFEDLTRIVKEF